MTPAVLDRAAAMADLWDVVLTTVDELPADSWDLAVPWTPGWTVADLVSHLGGLQTMFNGAPQPEPPSTWQAPDGLSLIDTVVAHGLAARSEWDSDQRRAELQAARDGHVAALHAVEDWTAPANGPNGPTTQAGLFSVRAFDIWVHLQDLRQAVGLPVVVDDPMPAAVAAYEFTANLVPWMFVKRAGATDGDALLLSLSAPLSRDGVVRVVERRANWEDPGAAVGDRVAVAPGALTLLTSGRADAAHWQNVDALEWTGALATTFVERARMF